MIGRKRSRQRRDRLGAHEDAQERRRVVGLEEPLRFLSLLRVVGEADPRRDPRPARGIDERRSPDVEIGDAMENKELPFVIGVVGDFGGNSDVEKKRLKDRKFVNIDSGNFDEVLRGVEPVARFQVPNQLTGDDSSFNEPSLANRR